MLKLQSSADRGLQIQHRKRKSEVLLIKKNERARYGTWTHDPQIKSLMLYRLS